MRWLSRRHVINNGQIVDRGRVWCPARRRDVDIDRCYACEAFEGLTRDAGLQLLRCEPMSRWPDIEGYALAR